MTTDPAAEDLRVRLVSPAEVRAGETVPLTVRLENTGRRPLELYLRGRPIAVDVVISDGRGALVWQRLRDVIIPAIIQLRILEPASTLELSAEWDQRDLAGRSVAPGTYMIRASVLTDQPAPLEAEPAALRIRARS